MSINNISNTVFSNTLSGLDTLNVTDITINGVNVTSLFVPYNGANINVDLNNKNLSGVNSLTGTSIVVSGTVQGLNLTATGLTTTNTLKINSVPSGIVEKALGIDSAGNVIEGSFAPTQISVTDIPNAFSSPMYFPYVIINSTGIRTLYVDTDSPITYNTNSKTLTIKNLTASIGSNWTNYGTTFNQTLQCGSLSITSSVTFPAYCNFNTLPSIGIPSYFLALDSLNRVIVSNGISAQPTVTASNIDSLYYIVFAPNSTTTASSPIYVDSNASLSYNPFSNTLSVPSANIDNLSVNGNFTANGINNISGYSKITSPDFLGIPTAPTGLLNSYTKQIANHEFVQNMISSLPLYLPLTGGEMTGTISFGYNTNNIISLYYNKFTQYTYDIIDTQAHKYLTIKTDAVNSNLIGTIDLLRDTYVTGQLLVSNNLVINGLATNNQGMIISNGGVVYANIGLNGFNTIFGNTHFYDNISHAVMSVSFATGINHNISSTTSYNFQTTNGSIGKTIMNLSENKLKVSTNIIDFDNVQEIHFTGNGVNWFFANIQLGYWDNMGLNDWRINATNNLVLQATGSILLTQSGNTISEINNNLFKINTAVTVQTQDLGQLRLLWDNSSRGVFFRNDSQNFYILKTNLGTPNGLFDSTRPFRIDLDNGKIHSENGSRLTGGLECDTFTCGINTGNHIALNGGNYFLMQGGLNVHTNLYLPQGHNLYKVYVSTLGNQFGTNDQWYCEALVRYNNNQYYCAVTNQTNNNAILSGDQNGLLWCHCPLGLGYNANAWITWQRVI